MSRKIKPQTTLKGATVVKKIGKWTIEAYQGPNNNRTQFAITDGMLVYYPVIYDDFRVAYDNPYPIPKKVREWFEKNARRLKKMGRVVDALVEPW